MTDIAKCLIKFYDLQDKVSLDIVGIRPGEKIHEEMISSEEWLRTIDGENYLIDSETHFFNPGEPDLKSTPNREMHSYNSENSVMGFDEAYKFLLDTEVLK